MIENNSEEPVVFRNCVFPSPDLRKTDRAAIAADHGFAHVRERTRPCHRPRRNGTTCGMCRPCLETRKDGLGPGVISPPRSCRIQTPMSSALPLVLGTSHTNPRDGFKNPYNMCRDDNRALPRARHPISMRSIVSVSSKYRDTSLPLY